ncbi:MAG: energy transducer TonB [Deltaproteobacteria bacterium]|nr:energy transducer TonB [Deltaproteobacteria bacterium]
MTRTARTLAALALAVASAGAGVRAGEVDLVAAPPNPEVRLEQIRERVQAAVVYPPAARERGIQGVARIQFRIDPAGRAADVVTVESSGSQLLDGAALQAARDALTLPQLYGWVRIPVRFELARR